MILSTIFPLAHRSQNNIYVVIGYFVGWLEENLLTFATRIPIELIFIFPIVSNQTLISSILENSRTWDVKFNKEKTFPFDSN